MDKRLVYLFVGIGGTAGGYLPVLFGAGGFSIWAIIGSTIGGVAGIYIAYKLSN